MDFNEDIEKALDVLRRGGLILYPTDTIWGIGCDATNREAVERIYELKKRPGTKSMIVLLADEKDLFKYVSSPEPEIVDYISSAAKPVSIIFQGVLGLAENLYAPDGSAAIRVVKEDFCRHLIRRFKKPVVSTSANKSGEESPGCFSEIGEEIKSGVDYIVHYRRTDESRSAPSSVIKYNRGEITVIRE